MSNKVPQIRFNGYSDAWEERKLGDEVRIVMGQSPNSKNYTDDPNDYILVQGNADMKNGRVFPRVWTTQVTKQAEKDDLILSVRAPVGDIGKTAYDVVIGRGVAAIKGNEFIFQNLGKMKSDGYWTRYSTGSTFESINSTDIKEAIISVPAIEEQNKIGSFFKQLDNTIALHQRKLDLLKEQKKGYLQKMFPKNGEKVPELRFEGFADAWEERKLGDTETHFTDGNYGESYPSAKDMSDKANGIPFLRGSDFSNGYLDSSNANYIKPEKHAELTSGHIKQDDIVLAVRGSLGTLGYATKENEGWNINSQLAILRTNKSEISGMFLIQYLLGSKGQKEIFSRNTGTALKQLPIKQLKDIPVPVPTLLEQQKIGSFFKQLDDTIALHQRKLDLLKEQKKGFLQKMFV